MKYLGHIRMWDRHSTPGHAGRECVISFHDDRGTRPDFPLGAPEHAGPDRSGADKS
ncbi:hypothetical protein GXY_03788 [Novacetimonas hansenii ATCC 23769]|uniref:Uncharacterized protein n=1 Tax=Novacetimonas hansenii ATCC 23769 TaxID=714995 RepID=D5QCA7_NOVHA|nr:hypothetical protein GXY_03788 [Novacetimonas hansenii ATCC 23769]